MQSKFSPSETPSHLRWQDKRGTRNRKINTQRTGNRVGGDLSGGMGWRSLYGKAWSQRFRTLKSKTFAPANGTGNCQIRWRRWTERICSEKPLKNERWNISVSTGILKLLMEVCFARSEQAHSLGTHGLRSVSKLSGWRIATERRKAYGTNRSFQSACSLIAITVNNLITFTFTLMAPLADLNCVPAVHTELVSSFNESLTYLHFRYFLPLNYSRTGSANGVSKTFLSDTNFHGNQFKSWNSPSAIKIHPQHSLHFVKRLSRKNIKPVGQHCRKSGGTLSLPIMCMVASFGKAHWKPGETVFAVHDCYGTL